MTPGGDHTGCREEHDRSGNPSEYLLSQWEHERSRHFRIPGQQHHYDHDRHGGNTIDHGAPEKRFDWIDRREIQCYAQ